MTTEPNQHQEQVSLARERELRALRREKAILLLCLHALTGQSVLKLFRTANWDNPRSDRKS